MLQSFKPKEIGGNYPQNIHTNTMSSYNLLLSKETFRKLSTKLRSHSQSWWENYGKIPKNMDIKW